MRCLALAEEFLSRGHQLVLCACKLLPSQKELIQGMGVSFFPLKGSLGSTEDLKQVENIVRSENIDAVITDSYSFESDYYRGLRKLCKYLISFDDMANLADLPVDVVLNTSTDQYDQRYKKIAPKAMILQGIDYSVIRWDIVNQRYNLPAIEERNHIFISFGGTDTGRMTQPVVEEILRREHIDTSIDVVIGGGVSEADELIHYLLSLSPHITCHYNSQNLGDIMAHAGLAITAGGVTSRELLTLGVPSLVVVLVDNQRANSQDSFAAGGCEMLDIRQMAKKQACDLIADQAQALWLDKAARVSASALLLKYHDGKGCARICQAIENLILTDIKK